MRPLQLIARIATVSSVLSSTTLSAQWTLQESHTKASLRGISSVSSTVAWASGTNGTVLHTTDGGTVWQPCAIPAGAEKLDFRGIQAFDAQTALVMSSGKGPLSTIYKTTDGCKSWTKVFDNPDADGFFDCLRRVTDHQLYLLGDPVNGKFSMFVSMDSGDNWFIADDPGLDAPKDAGAFAASNSSLINAGTTLFFGTGGPQAAVYMRVPTACKPGQPCSTEWKAVETPLAHGAAASGVFSMAGYFSIDEVNGHGVAAAKLVAVGGTYDKPADATATAAYSLDSGRTWQLAAAMPDGYRSAVAYAPDTKSFIAVGPSGTDVSRDNGQHWSALTPATHEPSDANAKWNALSLPFVVGPGGRIGKLRDDVLKPVKK